MKRFPLRYFHKTLLLAVIPLLWGGMMFTLLQRQAASGERIDFLSGRFSTFTPFMGTQWHIVRRGDEPIGYLRSTLRERDDPEQPYELSEEAVLTTQIGDQEVQVTLSTDSTLTSGFELASVTGELGLGAIEFAVSGTRIDDRFSITLSGVGQSIQREIDVPAGSVSGFSLYPFLASAELETGVRFSVPRFDALTQQSTELDLVYLGESTYDAPDGKVAARQFTLGLGASSSTVWIDTTGRLLREETSGYISELTTARAIAPVYRRFNREAAADTLSDSLITEE